MVSCAIIKSLARKTNYHFTMLNVKRFSLHAAVRFFNFSPLEKLIYVIMFRRGFYDSWRKIFLPQLEC